MKKLTMTRVLTPLAALAFTLGAQATAVSTDGFETYAAGSSVTNATGWSFTAGGDGAPDASAVTAYGEAATPSVLPDGTTAGNNFLKLSTEDGILFRNMNGTAAGGSVDLYQGLYVDTDVQFTLTDKSDRPTPDGADKFIIWLEADEDAHSTNLCVWAREYAFVNGALDYAAGSNKVYTLDASAVVPGSWHRLTVKAIKQSHTTDVPVPGFQVYLDNTLLTSSQQQIVPDDDYNDAKDAVEAAGTPLFDLITGDLKFFPAMAGSLTALSQVGFSGEGKIDNLVVTRDLPGFTEPTTVRFDFDMDVIDSIDIDELGVALTSTNDTISVAPDATFTFAINWKSGYSASMFNIATSASGYATVSDYAVTADGFGLGVITVATTAKDTTDVTFTWDALNDAMGEQVTENTGISFTMGGTTYDVEDLDTETSKTITGVKTGTNIVVNVTFSTDKWVAAFTNLPTAYVSANGMTLTLNSRPESGTVTVAITAEAAAVAPKATVNGVECATLAEAIAAAKNTAYPVVLCDNIELDAAEAIAVDETVTIDLNGYTITGADDVAVFTNAGTLTITDSSEDKEGAVVAGSDGYVVANTGTLSLEYGAYAGQFTNSGTFTITADCEFDNDLDGAYSPTAGYEVAETSFESGIYKLKLISYTITYYNGDQLLDVAPASYTVEDTVTLTNEVDLGVVGVSFQAWTNAEGTVVAGWSAGDKTGAQTFYAQVTAVVPPSGETIEPGAQSTTTYSSQADAEAAAANVTIAASDAVTNALDSAAQATYLSKFEAKVVEAGESSYKIEIGLTAAAEAELEAVADAAVTTAASSLAAVASANQTVEVDAEPGFYYSVASGTEVGSLTEGARTLATGSKVNLTLPTKGAKGFYRVLINVTP